MTLVVSTTVTMQRLAAERKGVPWPPPAPDPPAPARDGALAVPPAGADRDPSPKGARDGDGSLAVPGGGSGGKGGDPSPKAARAGGASPAAGKVRVSPPVGSRSRATGPRVPNS